MDAIPVLLTRKDIATRIHSSIRKVDEILSSSSGPRVTRIGATVLVRSDHFIEWLDGLAASKAETNTNMGGYQ